MEIAMIAADNTSCNQHSIKSETINAKEVIITSKNLSSFLFWSSASLKIWSTSVSWYDTSLPLETSGGL